MITSYQAAFDELNSHTDIVIDKQNISILPWKYIACYVFRLAAINNMLETNGTWGLLISVLWSEANFLFVFFYLT